MKKIMIAGFLGTVLLSGTLAPFQARASEDGRRNTTIALGAATAYLLSQHKWVPAAVAAAGTAVAYHNYKAAVDARHRYEDGYYYDRSGPYGAPNVIIEQGRGSRYNRDRDRDRDRYDRDSDRDRDRDRDGYDRDRNHEFGGGNDRFDNDNPGWQGRHGNGRRGHGRISNGRNGSRGHRHNRGDDDDDD